MQILNLATCADSKAAETVVEENETLPAGELGDERS